MIAASRCTCSPQRGQAGHTIDDVALLSLSLVVVSLAGDVATPARVQIVNRAGFVGGPNS